MKNVKIILLILAVSLSIVGSSAFAQVENETGGKVVKTLLPPPVEDCPSEETCELWEGFKEKYGERWSVEWQGDKAKEIYGRYNLGKGEITTERKAEEVAREFLSDNSQLFKIDLLELVVKKKELDRRGVWTVDYEQYYNGVHVYRGEVRVLLNNRSELTDVLNNFYPGIDISTTPVITRAKAVDVVLKQEGADLSVTEIPLAISKTVLSIVPKSENRNITYHLTWRVPTHTAIYFISTEDGSIVLRVQTASPETGNSGSIGGVNYGTFALALLKKLWIPVALFMLISFVVWKWRR